MSIRSFAVFCGSQKGANPLFEEHAAMLGKLLAQKEVSLIYGGGNVGLMGAVANAAIGHQGKVIGIIPKVLVEWEREHKGVTQLIITEDMHSRKKMIYEMCDAAIALPGGFGTLDELFEMLTWNQLSIHDKRIFVLNSAGFYDHMVSHLHKMEQEKFLYDKISDRVVVINEPAQLLPWL